jgi:LmbE family N-acetylglucosaminyl deacetylase
MVYKQLILLSPHLDDAVISCCDHIVLWKNQGYSITVINVFTSFQSKTIPKYSQTYIKQSGCTTGNRFERMRHQEDEKAKELLGGTWHDFHYIDGGFRGNIKPIYPTRHALFSGTISPEDADLVTDLQGKFLSLKCVDRVIVPLGVGKHADHRITKKAAQLAFPKEKLSYFVDISYAQTIQNWTAEMIIKLICMKKSIRRMTAYKQTVLQCYRSQLPFLFPKKSQYPEIILSP